VGDVLIRRTVTDLGVDLMVEIPDGWLEFEDLGPILAIGGPLGDGEGTLQPSLQVDVDQVADDDDDDVFGSYIRSIGELPEVEVLSDRRGERGGRPASMTTTTYRNPESGGLQLEVTFAVLVEDPYRAVVRATGTCGGSASESVIRRLGEIVTSLGVEPTVPEHS